MTLSVVPITSLLLLCFTAIYANRFPMLNGFRNPAASDVVQVLNEVEYADPSAMER